MGIDEKEKQRRARADHRAERGARKEPIAAIEKRVIDSPAFATLAPSAVTVLLLLARNLPKDRNGRTFVSESFAARHGVERKTLHRRLRELTVKGFTYPTRRGGNGECSTYALTWLPLDKDTRGLFVANFVPHAYRQWSSEYSDEIPRRKDVPRPETFSGQDLGNKRQIWAKTPEEKGLHELLTNANRERAHVSETSPVLGRADGAEGQPAAGNIVSCTTVSAVNVTGPWLEVAYG